MTVTRAGRRTAAALATTALLLPLTACGGGSKDGASGESGGKTKLTVLAASSLTDVFNTAKKAYEKKHPDTRLTFDYEGSQELASKVRDGAPADALVTADNPTMDKLKSDTGSPQTIAKNRLVIATGKGNPKKVKKLTDLQDSKRKVVLAAPEVPVGRYSKQVLARQHLHVKPVSQETNVRQVLSKVQLGEADAGIVYKTDAATTPDKVTAVQIPDSENAIASYPAATLKTSQHSAEAKKFVRWLSSTQAQKIMRDAGFQKP